MKRPIRHFLLALAIFPMAPCAFAQYTAIPLDGFADGAKHWRNGTDTDGYPTYRPEQIVEIAENIMLAQRENGGWPPNLDPTRILNEAERAKLAEERSKEDTSFDNRNSYTQAEYLAAVFDQTRDPRHRDACLRGLRFILGAQQPSGGWPHSFPAGKGYRAHITFADDVMTGILRTLRKAGSGAEPFGWLDPEVRAQAAEATKKGDALVLKLQVVVDGKPTVWTGQYDRETLQPTQARSFELPSLVAAESVGVVEYLMEIERPSDEVVRAVEGAIDWFERSKIKGLRIEKVAAEKIRFDNHTSEFDLKAVADPDAPPIWARFYEIETYRPFMANRDGKKVYSLAEVERERRTGYSWYGYYPRALLEKQYPAWRKRIASASGEK